MVTYPKDHYRKSPMTSGSHKEFPPRVNGIDTFPAIYLLCLLMMFLIIGVFWWEYHRNEKTPKKDEEISATIGDLLKKLDKAEKDRDVLREKIDEIAQEKEFPPRVNGIDTFPAIYLLCLLVMFLIIGVFWWEYHRNDDLLRILEKTRKKDEEISATIGDLLKKLGDFLKKLDVLQEKIDEIAQEKEQLKKEIERKRAQFKSAWRDIPLYGDWRKEEFQAVNLTLDAATAHPALFLSEEGRRITWQEPCQDLPSSPERFVSLPCVLGQLHVSSERYFWEVEVQDAHSWDLGVCMNNVARTGRITVSPQNGFWAIRLYSGEYWGLTSPETSLTLKEKPCKVGVFLDYEAGDVSFYNMTDGSHIYTFSKQTFHGVLRPLFRLWSSDSGPLTIVQVE